MYEEDALKVFVQNGKPAEVNLVENDFITEGGEGKIYGKGNTIYKIYSDPSKMINPAKISELTALDSPNILGPKNILLDTKGMGIGYCMDWAKDTVALCKLFTNDFRTRFNITEDMISKLVENTRKEISFIHGKGAYLQVDGNEMNYLVDSNNFIIPKLIDVDSFKTPSFPPTAIMASIKDHHSSQFSELTDWFAFAVVVTQLFVGIHPYKGTHPNFKKSDMEGRMKANVSIFNTDVRLPGTTRDLSCIPTNYRTWLTSLFEKGERTLPPGTMGNIIAVAAHVASIGSNQFDITLVGEYLSDVCRYKDGYVTLVDEIIIPNGGKTAIVSPSVEIIHTLPYSYPVKVWVDNGFLSVETLKAGEVLTSGTIPAEDKMVIGNSVFIKNEGKLIEYQVQNMGNNMPVAPSYSMDVMPNATKLFNQIVYQDILGLPMFMIFGKSANTGKTFCFQYRIPELKGYQVLEAKFENGVAMIVASKSGQFDVFTVKFGKTFPEYVCTCEQDAGYHVPNFTVLENGLVVCITPDDEVRIFSNNPGSPAVNVIKDPVISFEMKLCHNGMKVMYRRGKKLYQLAVKK